MFKYLLPIYIFCMSCLITNQAFCQAIDLVWLETDSIGSTIFYSQYKKYQWSTKAPIVAGTEVKLSPTIASTKNVSMAIWVTIVEPAGLSFNYSRKINQRWQNPQQAHFNFHETTGPALIVFEQKYFLFFAGNSSDDDDIYMSIYENNGWNEPIMVHPDNNTPDVLPEPKIIDGVLTLFWQHFDGDRYVYKSQKVVMTEEDAKGSVVQSLDFQRTQPKTASKNDVQNKKEQILKTKFNIDLPSDYDGIGPAKAYDQNDSEMPALHINSPSL